MNVIRQRKPGSVFQPTRRRGLLKERLVIDDLACDSALRIRCKAGAGELYLKLALRGGVHCRNQNASRKNPEEPLFHEPKLGGVNEFAMGSTWGSPLEKLSRGKFQPTLGGARLQPQSFPQNRNQRHPALPTIGGQFTLFTEGQFHGY